jgi:hypothetical protein
VPGFPQVFDESNAAAGCCDGHAIGERRNDQRTGEAVGTDLPKQLWIRDLDDRDLGLNQLIL